MSETILLLGLGREAGTALAGSLTELGYSPAAGYWEGGVPRTSGRRRPRAVIADVDGPDTPAAAAVVAAVRRGWGSACPTLAVTATRKFGALAALLDAGIAACLPKPVPVELLAKTLRRCLATEVVVAPTADLPASLLEVFLANDSLLRLGDLVTVHAGATPRRPTYRRLAPPDATWRGVVTADRVDRFYLGRPTSFLSWNRLHLFRLPPESEYAVAEKVLLRRAGPPLAAAVDRSRLPAGTDVYSLVPRAGSGATAGYIACLLNSRLLDFYFNRMAPAGPDGRLRLEALRAAPVPPPTPRAVRDCNRAAALLSHFGPSPRNRIDRVSREEVLLAMEDAIFDRYRASREARRELAAMHF
ncbi:MAG: hypothetical protein LIP77_00200 [Planctomycetes bacterium]|nr:hypothetical protein [Planctomycetota bacterium]